MFTKSKLLIVLLILLSLIFALSTKAQWLERTAGLPNFSYTVSMDAYGANSAVIPMEALFKTVDGGENWTNFPLPEYGIVWDVSMIDNLHIWLCGWHGKIYATSDGGNSWTLQFHDTTLTKFMNYIEMFDLNYGVAMGDSVHNNISDPIGRWIILKTSDGGKNWVSINTSSQSGFSGDLWRRIDFVNKDIGYFYASGASPARLFKTSDGGKSWIQTGYPGSSIQVLKFYNENMGLAIPHSGRIFRTLDGGSIWEYFTTPHVDWPSDIEFAPSDPSKVWIADNFTLYVSSDTGRTWNEEFTLPHGGDVDIVFTDKQNGWFLTRQAVYRTITGGGSLLTGFYKDTETSPNEFGLLQNYPNPFNPSTTICFNLLKPCFVKLIVFNLLGHKIETLVSDQKQPGEYKIKWTAEGLPGGIYLYHLEAGEFVETKKLILLR